MSKEMKRLKSKMKFCNSMIYVIMILLIQIITLLAFLTICIVGGSNDYE